MTMKNRLEALGQYGARGGNQGQDGRPVWGVWEVLPLDGAVVWLKGIVAWERSVKST